MEELSPDTYKRAGQILKDKGKPERGSKLINYHDELTSGFFNLIDSSGNKWVVTRPTSEFYYSFFSKNSNSSIINMDINNVDELIESWVEGSRYLSFTINVKFILKDDPKFSNYNRETSSMSFEFILNDWGYGKKEFQADWDLDELDIYDFYKDSNEGNGPFIYLKRGFWTESGYKSGIWKKELRLYDREVLFADRKSAIRFKKILPDLVTEHKDKIMDIFSIIGTDVDEWDKIIKSIKDIRINNLYVDKSDGIKQILSYPLN